MKGKNKRPRHYAFEIIKLETLQERHAALLDVPKEWRGLVKKHLEIMWQLK